jgi:hypothetical protein
VGCRTERAAYLCNCYNVTPTEELTLYGSRPPRGGCSLAYDLFRCFLGLPMIGVELSFSMLFRNPSASLAFDAFSFSAGSSLFGCLFCMTSRSHASEAHSTAIRESKSDRLSFACPDPIRLI